MYVELKDINKTYAGYQASNHVSFGIEQGRLIALLGPSGSGKTTILRMIAGLETPDSGEIVIDGKVVNNIPASERGIGFVFQNYALFRYMTVYDNIAFGLNVKKENKKYIDERVHELLKLISLEGLEKRYPSQLSGGQRQRVAFARALAPNPHLLLLDEPFAAIDAKVRQELRSWLKEMIEKRMTRTKRLKLPMKLLLPTRDTLSRREHRLKFTRTRRRHLRRLSSDRRHRLPIIRAFTASRKWTMSIKPLSVRNLSKYPRKMKYSVSVLRLPKALWSACLSEVTA